MRPIYDDHGAFLGSELVGGSWHANGSEGGKALAAAAVQKAMTPAPSETIEEWLAELSVITARRAEDDFTDSLRLDAYSKRLRGYPADVVRSALFDSRWKFWPTWAELADACDKIVAPRKAMAAALNTREQAVKESTEDRERITADRASEIMREVGFRPRTFGGEA